MGTWESIARSREIKREYHSILIAMQIRMANTIYINVYLRTYTRHFFVFFLIIVGSVEYSALSSTYMSLCTYRNYLPHRILTGPSIT